MRGSLLLFRDLVVTSNHGKRWAIDARWWDTAIADQRPKCLGKNPTCREARDITGEEWNLQQHDNETYRRRDGEEPKDAPAIMSFMLRVIR